MIHSQQVAICEAIQQHGFKRLLLAVSGGLDSICLAHYFVTNKDALDIEWLGIAHVNHGLRAGSAELDEKLVREFAEEHNVPFFCTHLDGDALKASEGSLEEKARDARYKALFEIARSPIKSGMTGYDASGMTDNITIVTAHHAGDQAETVYMRLLRGTTLEGLRGMESLPRVAWSQMTVHPTIYRPFLDVPRADLLEYARENNLVWREDESNSDTKFMRNRIRHESLPALENDNPNAAAQLTRIANLAGRTNDKILAQADALFSPALFSPALQEAAPATSEPAGLPEKHIALDKKVLRKILVSHANANLSEMFRLWLSAKGFRFPIDFFKASKEPAGTRIPSPVAYRRRSIVKNGHTVWICEFESSEAAAKFVSCE
ncbi:tRNA lysidine(34) synthetase TilS [Fibrobacter sp.]|uniref:tRNA lysidine(34) synthetase TilS n=1 Tax=Fibrobacter sp. TaxID=35828 RepID=UPI00388E4E92